MSETRHAFEPSYSDPNRCGFIVEGETWTTMDPISCRKTRAEHEPTPPAEGETAERPVFWQHAISECNAAHVALDRKGAPKTLMVRRIRGEGDQEITIGLADRIAYLGRYKAEGETAEGLSAEQQIARLTAERDTALRIAAEATNGWACFAKRQSEHDDIARLHREISTLQEPRP